jgi:hypothetical protein
LTVILDGVVYWFTLADNQFVSPLAIVVVRLKLTPAEPDVEVRFTVWLAGAEPFWLAAKVSDVGLGVMVVTVPEFETVKVTKTV